MCLLLETIRVYDGIFCYPEYHQERMDRSREKLFPGSSRIKISEIRIPESFKSGVYKCRIIYGSRIEKTEFFPYGRKHIRNLKLVDAPDLDYSYKYLDRSGIEKLQESNPGYDEIILVKNRVITDTSFSNLAFLSGIKWFTPAEPLLAGTKRQRLIDCGILTPVTITVDDLFCYSHVSLINALLELTDILLPVSAIEKQIP